MDSATESNTSGQVSQDDALAKLQTEIDSMKVEYDKLKMKQIKEQGI